jgi:hypothetical protein
MSDTGPEFAPETPLAETHGHALRVELPYIAMLLGAFVGAAIHDFIGQYGANWTLKSVVAFIF